MILNSAKRKANGLLRYGLAHGFTRLIPLYVINEYPKSGGSWLGEMLSDALGVPFPRNRFPIFGRSILHGHMMQSWNIRNMVIVWRDGRDLLVSQYYHWLFKNDRGNAALVYQCRSELGFEDYNDITNNLPAFIEYMFVKKRHPRFSWTDFVNKWASNKDALHVRYEDLLTGPTEHLLRIAQELSGESIDTKQAQSIIEKYSFEKITGRKPGEANNHSFLRNGIAGDWKNSFNSHSKSLFNHYAGEALITLGYEKNDSWVRS